jgi:hypothetical protein
MLMATLITFLMSVVAVAFLLGLSPIFVSFILFQSTFMFFDQWIRFLASFSLQVMISFAILTLWMYSLTLFAPFFNELSVMIFPYQRVLHASGSTYVPQDAWGLCPMKVYFANGAPHAECEKSNFKPIPPKTDTEKGNKDYLDIIGPPRVPEMNEFLFYLFYNLVALLIVTHGFASLQENSSSIARQLAGPSYVPHLNSTPGMATPLQSLQSAGGDSQRIMSKQSFGGFNTRHESGKSWFERMREGSGNMAGDR